MDNRKALVRWYCICSINNFSETVVLIITETSAVRASRTIHKNYAVDCIMEIMDKEGYEKLNRNTLSVSNLRSAYDTRSPQLI